MGGGGGGFCFAVTMGFCFRWPSAQEASSCSAAFVSDPGCSCECASIPVNTPCEAFTRNKTQTREDGTLSDQRVAVRCARRLATQRHGAKIISSRALLLLARRLIIVTINDWGWVEVCVCGVGGGTAFQQTAARMFSRPRLCERLLLEFHQKP